MPMPKPIPDKGHEMTLIAFEDPSSPLGAEQGAVVTRAGNQQCLSETVSPLNKY